MWDDDSPPAPAASQFAAPQQRAWTVSALLLAANDALAARFGAVTVVGEISGFSRAASGHCYFALKDAQAPAAPPRGAPRAALASAGGGALLRCAMFRRAAQLASFMPRDGQQVEVRGRLSVYEARGELQMVVEAMRPVGEGALYEQYVRLKAKLLADGLFDESRKRALPRYPCTIGVVTSTGGAVLHDVLTTLRRRAPHVRVIVYPCLVQGSAAPDSILAALQVAQQRDEVDTLIVCRGGGSLEDLWAFNDERVVRAVAGCGLPVLCAIGHETDTALAELAADLRAPTPTAAAELVCASRDTLMEALQAMATSVSRRVRHRLESQAQGLDVLALRLGRPASSLAVQDRALRALATRLQSARRTTTDHQAHRLSALAARLLPAPARQLQALRSRLDRHEAAWAALNPAGVLARGYGWIEGPDQRPILGIAQLKAGLRIDAVLHDGRARAEILGVMPDPAEAPAPVKPRRPRRKSTPGA